MTSGRQPQKAKAPVVVVGVGASAGGLEALEAFFDHLPHDSDLAFVVVQHLSPDFKSLMQELLARHTKMAIHRVEDGMVVEPNGVYLIPPKKNMVLSEGRLLLSDQDSSGGLNLPIDLFFRSLAQDKGTQSVAVVLSGTGSDGSRGIVDVHTAGGYVLAQSIESAGFDGMPRNAIATGVVHRITDPGSMAALLLEFAANPDSEREPPREMVVAGNEMTEVYRLFRTRYAIDFSQYRGSTINRRIERRVQHSNSPGLTAYVRALEHDNAELDRLYRDLLVEVTQFFRDPQAFARLRRDLVPAMLQGLELRKEIRVWVAGCATGQEAYTLAMILDDCVQDLAGSPAIKVFATDVHQSSLETASNGIYPLESLAAVPKEFQQRYFDIQGELCHVSRDLRRTVIFSPHDITKDPPFTKIDLFSCRNVLIYLEPDVQRRVLSLFHFGMRQGGLMMLGPSETVGDLAPEFETLDANWRIYRKLRDVRLADAQSMPLSPVLTSIVRSPARTSGVARLNEGNLQSSVQDKLLDRYVPPSFLVDEHHELTHSFGDARRYLVQPKGRPTINVLKMVEGDLRMALNAALHRAQATKERVCYQGVRIETDSGSCTLQVIVEPYIHNLQTLYLVCLEELNAPYPPPEPTAVSFDNDDESSAHIAALEQELTFTKESLQTTVEELESSNEELQSTNEELVASNEELQSTNEELHSVNEELYTVNAEHQRKIEELTQLTADVDNLMNSTDIGTIFLDSNLRIRMFTPAIAAAFNVLDQDVGRPIEHIAYHLDNPNFLEEIRQVLETETPIEKEVRNRDGKRFHKRMRPYRDATGKADGVVITFTDVSAMKDELERRADDLENANRELQEFAYAVSHDLRAPARHLSQIAKLLKQSEDSYPNAFKQSLDQLVSEADRVQRMLTCLLEYSRVNTGGGLPELTSTDEALEEALRKLEPDIRARDVRIEKTPLPDMLADPRQLEQVFRLLLDNAIKFNNDPLPKVSISSERRRGDIQFTIADNGRGFEPHQFEKAFVIFQRFNQGEKTSIPGDGVGLPVCRRIIERHQGKIWIEANPPQGCRVIFTLPATPHEN